MAAIHRTSLDCVFVLDAQWRIVEFNPAAERAFGCKAAEVISLPIAQFFVAPRSNHSAGFLTTEGGTALGKQIEVIAKRPAGSTFPAEMAITAARFNWPPVFIAVLRDISQRQPAPAAGEEFNNRL